jgi:ribonucleoside-diphosphate reductase alpha chain
MEIELMDQYQQFIYKRTYARWIPHEHRRENWDESVNRYADFMVPRVPDEFVSEFNNAINDIHSLDVMPSMRALWTAGPALKQNNVSAFNCVYQPIVDVESWSEMMLMLMNGCGVGFSVERQYINKLPEIPEDLEDHNDTIVFEDSKEGWAFGFRDIIKAMYNGKIYDYDLSRLRPVGTRLKTFGGKSSGPEPLDQLLKFVIQVFKNAKGRKLNSLECHDICCYTANCVVSGGVRRSATISLSNLTDERLQAAKRGEFWRTHPFRALANNSVAYTEKPGSARFMREWVSLVESGSGERGIFNRESADFVAMRSGRRSGGYEWGCNPCSEIILRPYGLCNLSEVIVKPVDSLNDLKKKIETATILGCLQSTLTNFDNLRPEWQQNAEEERLLGVSLSGLADHRTLNHTSNTMKKWLTQMKEVAIETAEIWSDILDINMPTAITCIKPSGTVSQLCSCSSGLHPAFSPYYIRRVRVSATDNLAKYMIDAGVDYNPEVGQTPQNASLWVFDFPRKSAKHSCLVEDVNALDQLEYWLAIQQNYCEHKPSCTIYVDDHEWMAVGAWIYDNWEWVSGISFLPKSDTVYQLMPYEEISKDKYRELRNDFPTLNFNDIMEEDDMTVGAQEYACVSGSCDLI